MLFRCIFLFVFFIGAFIFPQGVKNTAGIGSMDCNVAERAPVICGLVCENSAWPKDPRWHSASGN
jgi:hypothetical protein